MIGSGLKKLANEYGMKVDSGVGYGSIGGYAATLSEGDGFKRIDFSVWFRDPARKTAFMQKVGHANLQKDYQIQNLGVGERTIQIIFTDNMGTMKKIRAFLEWFLPLLKEFGASDSNVCQECGGDIISGKWVLVDGTAHHFHDTCADKVIAAVVQDNARHKEEDTGSYATGTVGALVGAALGAVVWALVLSWGYVASLVGLLIGWLADKGYNLLKGKKGKLKILILIVAVIFGVVAGTYGGYALVVMQEFELSAADLPEIMDFMLSGNTGVEEELVSDILVGLLFAALGVWAMLRKAGQDVAGRKTVVLK